MKRTKYQIMSAIVDGVDTSKTLVTFKNVYGEPFSIVFDLYVDIVFKSGHTKTLYVKANRNSHALIGHSRPHLHGNDYKGTQPVDYYRDKVRDSWTTHQKRTFKEYLDRFTKKQLLENFGDVLWLKNI